MSARPGLTPEIQRAVLQAVYDERGQVRLPVQQAVEEAIKRYPQMDADWWIGGVAAIRALLDAIGIDYDTR